MTATQKALIAGFNASLKKRGVAVFLQSPQGIGQSGKKFMALVELAEPEQGENQFQKEIGNQSILHILRDDLAGVTVTVGSVFKSFEGDSVTTYRVTKKGDNAIGVAVRLPCEVTTV